MNGRHHRSLMRAVRELLRLSRGATDPMILGSEAPDHAVDVFVHMPNGERVTEVLGREVAALKHFQPGYCWQDDPSLSVLEQLGDLGAKVLGMTVSGDSVPMIRACRAQPGATLCELRFPSAADMAGHHAAVANGDPFQIGEACHYMHDTTAPHHALGMILGGHQTWEDQAEAQWLQHVEMLMVDPAQIFATLGEAVAKEKCAGTSVEELCEENAEWSRRWFADKDLTECTWDAALAVSIRAIASSMKAVTIMTKGAA